jgi:hypothetical protein
VPAAAAASAASADAWCMGAALQLPAACSDGLGWKVRSFVYINIFSHAPLVLSNHLESINPMNESLLCAFLSLTLLLYRMQLPPSLFLYIYIYKPSMHKVIVSCFFFFFLRYWLQFFFKVKPLISYTSSFSYNSSILINFIH